MTGPWGTPLVTSYQLDFTPLSVTLWAMNDYELQLPGKMQGYSNWQLNTEDIYSNSEKTIEEQSGVTCRQREEEKDVTHETQIEKNAWLLKQVRVQQNYLRLASCK